MMSTSGDIMSRGMFSTSAGYHEYIGGYHEYVGDVQYIGVFNKNQKPFMNLLPHMNHDTPPCTEHLPMY